MARQQNEGSAGKTRPASVSEEASTVELVAVVRAAERFAAAIEARAIALMLQLDLTMPQLRAVTTLRRLGRANGRQLAAALILTPGAVVAICDHLEKREYVRRLTDTRDRRITWFELTEQGAAALKAALTIDSTIARSRTKALISGLTESEREGFIKIADAFADALGSVLQAETPDADDHADTEHPSQHTPVEEPTTTDPGDAGR
jgi:DNA-binding MarR family transcriptional regulator